MRRSVTFPLSADELPSLSGQPLGHESTFCLFDLQFPLSLLQLLLSYRQGVVPFPHFTDEFQKRRGAVIYRGHTARVLWQGWDATLGP